eukprot:TRINITY_DN499_c0_g1_i1.p1 TRINITY_DN499_c0_g1~~TRINITY_DN499_c0_g1_i1.p1  ORF type:complete len:346 (-),score=120.56 TRINITY_DN499_c0_g1_i1:80-1117(-)
MKGVAFVIFAILAFACANVVQLNPNTFGDLVGDEQHVLVKFFAPWCGHCKALAPVFEELAQTYSKDKAVLISEVNCDDHQALCQEHGIKGYPTLKYFPKGSETAEDYNGGRDLIDFVTFINEKTGLKRRVHKTPTPVVELRPDNFDSIVIPEKTVFVKFFAPWCGHCKRLAPIYEELARAFAGEDSVVIAEANVEAHQELGDRFGVTGFPTLKLFVGDEMIEFDGARDLAEMTNFVNDKAGTFRNPDGTLNEMAAFNIDLFEITAGFLAAEDKDAELAKAESIEVSDQEEADKKIYIKVLKKIMDKGDGYVKTEIARLERMLGNASLSNKKKTMFMKKLNILKQF